MARSKKHKKPVRNVYICPQCRQELMRDLIKQLSHLHDTGTLTDQDLDELLHYVLASYVEAKTSDEVSRAFNKAIPKLALAAAF